MAFVAIALATGLAAPASPAGASSPNAASSAKACTRGQSIDNLGFHWVCSGPPGRTQWTTAGPSQGGSPLKGAIGHCTPGDTLTVAGLRLACVRAGSKKVWSRSHLGAVTAAASKAIQAQPARLPGTCHKDSWLVLEGVAISCVASGKSHAWTAAGPPRNVPSTPVVAGMNRDACTNAWWDKEFAGHVPQLARRQDPALTESIWFSCHVNYAKYMTSLQKDKAYESFFAELGQLVANQVQQYSASTGKNPCQSVKDVMQPVIDDAWGLTGWRKEGFLPILYSEWQGGPFIGKLGDYDLTCGPGQVSMQLFRLYDGEHEGPYYPARGTPDASITLTQDEKNASLVNQAVCMVWAPEFGNDAPGSPGKVIAYTFTNRLDDGVNAVAADYGNLLCKFKVAESLGMPVVWQAQPTAKALQTVQAPYAGLWHTMAENCSWTLVPGDGGPVATWTPTNGRYTAVLLKTGDQFASTCKLYNRNLEHFLVIPDGLFPLYWTLAPGPRKPSTPSTCRYLITDAAALRQPPSVDALRPYAGETVSADDRVGPDGLGSYIYSSGCGVWELLSAPGLKPKVATTHR